jgi:hypothetical protein
VINYRNETSSFAINQHQITNSAKSGNGLQRPTEKQEIQHMKKKRDAERKSLENENKSNDLLSMLGHVSYQINSRPYKYIAGLEDYKLIEAERKPKADRKSGLNLLYTDGHIDHSYCCQDWCLCIHRCTALILIHRFLFSWYDS